MTRQDTIRYRPDGSIDTAFYMAKAREMRSNQARALLGQPSQDPRKAPDPRRIPLLW